MCKSPLKGFQIGLTDNGKPNYKVVSYHVDHLEKHKGIWRNEYDKFVSPFAEKVIREFTEIPCGHCIECYLNYSMTWANRCMMELTDYDPCECWFLTLTYDEEHIPKDGSLNKDDLQKFWKRLRQYIVRKCGEVSRLRYFACGEYGSKTFRCHHHAIVYGLPYIDLQSWVPSKSGFPLFRSETLEEIWQNGIVTVSPVSWNTCAYTARYVLKKADKSIDQNMYKELNVLPEYVTMSRRPGIGRSYYDLHKEDIYRFDEIILKTDEGGKIVKPPKYFDDLYEAECPEAYEKIKNKRKDVADSIRLSKLSRTDLEYLDYLKAEETALIGKLKTLRRDKI